MSIIRPQEGKQEQFLASSADIALYGGSAGGGKTYALLLEAYRNTHVQKYTCVFFRKTYPEITGAGQLWDESMGLYSQLGGSPVQGKLEWHWQQSGARILFRHMQHEKDLMNYQGAQIALICFDELTHFSKSQFFYMLSRNRTMSEIKPYVRATTNPDTDSWVREFIDWWIGKDGLAIENRSGVVRWFVNQDDHVHWFDRKIDAVRKFPDTPPKSFTFINSNVYDNKILMQANPEYISNLKALQAVEREKLLNGNWNVRAGAGDYFKKKNFEIVDAVPKMKHIVRCWDLAGTMPSETNPNPDWTVGLKVGICEKGIFWVLDMERERLNPATVKELIINTTTQDGKSVLVRIPQDAGSAGKVVAQDYTKALAGYSVKSKPVTGNKETRATPASSQAGISNIKLLRGPWNAAFLSEVEAFPLAAHDDIVDTLSDSIEELTEWRKPAKVIAKPKMVR